jgi:hypothetical protein
VIWRSWLCRKNSFVEVRGCLKRTRKVARPSEYGGNDEAAVFGSVFLISISVLRYMWGSSTSSARLKDVILPSDLRHEPRVCRQCFCAYDLRFVYFFPSKSA